MKATKREIAAKIASLVRKRNAINQEIHYWRSRQKPNTEPNTKPNTKERNEERSPTPPKEEKKENNNYDNPARAREGFVRPTIAEVAAYIREKGYTFSAEHFWHYNDNRRWRIGRNVMKSWRSACETWQAKENRNAATEAARQAHIDARMDERESMRRITDGERMNEAARVQQAKLHANAVAALTERDWALCAESCANCRASGGCLAGIVVPPDHRLNARPCSPAECPRFAAKEGGAA